MKVTLIGSGNVSTVLAKKINESGHDVLEIVEKNNHPVYESDLYIVAITDTALDGIHKWLKLENKMVVHTAGSISKDALRKVSRNYGVLYPLQSLRKDMQYLPEIPFLVDGNTPDNIALIKDFAETISTKVIVGDDELRLKLHVAAVFVNNFVNHMYTLAEKYCQEEKIDFGLLKPLIDETAHRLSHGKPSEMQTGPAVRSDEITIEQHTKALKGHKKHRKIYEALTDSIKRFHE